MSDPINPDHYKQHPSGIEVIEITRHLDYPTGCAVKYILRAPYKGSEIQDLKKAIWYLQDKIKLLQYQDEEATRDAAEFLTAGERKSISRAAELTDIHLGEEK